MTESRPIRVAVNGHGVIGKRVAAAVARQNDMRLAGVCDVVTDWRGRIVNRQDIPLFAASSTSSVRTWPQYSNAPSALKPKKPGTRKT